MKILVDMNLSPRWVPVLKNARFNAGFLAATAISMLRQCRRHLEAGALISLDETGSRVRILPIRQ